MAQKADGTVYINSLMDTSGFEAGGKDLESAAKRMAKRVAGVLAGALAVKELIGFGKEAIELGSDLQEVQNVVDVTFTHMSQKVDEFAKNAAQSAGLSETMAKRYAGTFGAMSKSFGFTEDAAYDMSTSLTQLAGDVASFYNITQDEAYTKLKSVFTGETETLKDLGVVMTQSALDAYALANGFGKTTQQMTEQEKVALRYRFVMEQLSAASGDFVRTSGSWANQVRLLKLQFDSLKATVGQGLINIFTPVIKVINTLLAKLATVANAFKAFTELITGKKSSGSTGAASAGLGGGGGGVAQIGDDYNRAAKGAENLADSTRDAADATKEAEKAAKGYLSPIDEINKLTTDAEDLTDALTPDTGSGAGGAGEGLADAINDVDYGKVAEGETVLDNMGGLLDKLMNKFRELKDLFKAGFWDGLGDYKPALEDLKNDIDSIKKTLKDIFTDPAVLAAIDNFANRFAYALGQVTGSIASIALTIARLFVGGIEKFLSQNKERLKKYIITMFDVAGDIVEIVGNLAVAFADIFSVFGSDTAQQIAANIIGIFAEVGMLVSSTALKLGRDILNMIAQPIIQNKDKIKEALEGTLGAIEPFTAGLLEEVQTVSDSITRIYDEHLKPFFDSIANGLSSIFGALLDSYNAYVVPVLENLGAKFQELMEGPFGEAIAKIENFIGKLIDAIRLLWEEVLVPFFEWIAENIMPVLAPIIQLVGETALNVLALILEAIGNLADILSGLIDFIVGIFTGDWEQAWTGIGEVFNGAWELMKGIVSGAWEAIKTIISGALNIVKTLIVTAWNGIKSLTSTAWSAIKTVISTAWATIKNAVSSAINNVKTKISNVWDRIRELTSDVWDTVRDTISDAVNDIWDTITGTFSNIWDTMRNVGSDIVNGIIDGIASAWDSLVGWAQSILDLFSFDIAGMVGDAMSAARDFIGISAMPSTPVMPAPIQMPDIPYLAKGAVIPPKAPFLAILGDQRSGTNIEAPLSTIEDAVERAMRKSGGNQSGGTIHIHVDVSGREMAEVVLTELELKRIRSGQPAMGGA